MMSTHQNEGGGSPASTGRQGPGAGGRRQHQDAAAISCGIGEGIGC
jgi:hypothetical protein